MRKAKRKVLEDGKSSIDDLEVIELQEVMTLVAGNPDDYATPGYFSSNLVGEA